MTRAELLEKLRELKPWLEEQGIVNLRLFGSYARDEAGPDSDVDLLVDTSRPMGIEFLTTERLLSERLETPVEFCSWEVMRPYVRTKVEKDLILVWRSRCDPDSRNPGRRKPCKILHCA